MNSTWIDTLYAPFRDRLSCETVLAGLKKEGAFVFENAFDTAMLRRIVTEIRKALKETGFGANGLPKLDNGFPDEPIFWYLRMVIESFFQRFLGSSHNLVSFDTMNETYDTSRIEPKPQVDVAFGSETTDAIHCIFQFKIRVINNGTNPEDFSVIEDEDLDGSGFTYYQSSNDPTVREALMTKFAEIKDGTRVIPTSAITAYLENELDCPKKVVTSGNTIIFFDGAVVHHANSSQKHVVNKRVKRDPEICRLAVYASVQRLCEVPIRDIKQRIEWLYTSAERKGTGHRITSPSATTPRYSKEQGPLRVAFKKSYVHKVKMVSTVPGSAKNRLLRATKEKNPFDFAAFGITDLRSFETKMTELSGVAYLNLDAVSQYDLVHSEKLEPYFVHNYLEDLNDHKKARLDLGLDGLFVDREAPAPSQKKLVQGKKEKVDKAKAMYRSMMCDSDSEQ